jgi:hypothetical protein
MLELDRFETVPVLATRTSTFAVPFTFKEASEPIDRVEIFAVPVTLRVSVFI